MTKAAIAANANDFFILRSVFNGLDKSVSSQFLAHLSTLSHDVDASDGLCMCRSVGGEVGAHGLPCAFGLRSRDGCGRCAYHRHHHGIIGHSQDIAAALDSTDVHAARMNILPGVMGMEDYAQLAVLVGEDRMVAGAVKSVPAMQERAVRALLAPVATGDVGGKGISHSIVLALIVIGRIGEEIAPTGLIHIGALGHAAHLEFPLISSRQALLEGSWHRGDAIVGQLDLPDAVAIIEADEEEVG